MPRGKTNLLTSNLSLVIPKRVHRKAKAAFLRSGTKSFGACVAWWLDQVPEQLAARQVIEAWMYEIELAA